MDIFRQDLISISITFAFGLFVGGYLYISTFAPLLSEHGLSGVREQRWELTAEEMGVCGERCAGVNILSDGSYRYRFLSPTSSEPIIREGVLPLSLRRAVRQETEGFIDSLFLRTSRATVCDAPSLDRGIETKYTLRYAGETYEFDSCAIRTELGLTDETALNELWRYLSDRWRS